MISVIGIENNVQEFQKIEQTARTKQKIYRIVLIALTAILFIANAGLVILLCRGDMILATPISLCICFCLVIIIKDSYERNVKTKLQIDNFTTANYKYNQIAKTYKSKAPTVYYRSTDSRDYFDLFAYDYSATGHPVPVKIGTFKRQIVSIDDYDDVVFDLTNMVCLDPE